MDLCIFQVGTDSEVGTRQNWVQEDDLPYPGFYIDDIGHDGRKKAHEVFSEMKEYRDFFEQRYTPFYGDGATSSVPSPSGRKELDSDLDVREDIDGFITPQTKKSGSFQPVHSHAPPAHQDVESDEDDISAPSSSFNRFAVLEDLDVELPETDTVSKSVKRPKVDTNAQVFKEESVAFEPETPTPTTTKSTGSSWADYEDDVDFFPSLDIDPFAAVSPEAKKSSWSRMIFKPKTSTS